MPLRSKVGQLVMLGFDSRGTGDVAVHAVRKYKLGAVTMIGRSYAGVTAVRRTTDSLQAAASTPLFIAADQEGGQVQVLNGPGFPEMPSAKEQGQLPPEVLEARASRWGAALGKAGVNLDLAPVLAVLPKSIGKENAPIGRYDRQYGSTAARVTSHGLAFAAGLAQASVTPVVKHFPGLGSVRANTDVTAYVTDKTTGRRSAAIKPFAAAVNAGLPMVMISSVTYARIDPDNIALFSHRVISGFLRDDLGFRGVVVSDDVGASASVAAAAPVAQRGVRFLAAGGDLVLTVSVADLPSMIDALIDRAKTNAAFAKLVTASVGRVLDAKKSAGLLHCTND